MGDFAYISLFPDILIRIYSRENKSNSFQYHNLEHFLDFHRCLRAELGIAVLGVLVHMTKSNS